MESFDKVIKEKQEAIYKWIIENDPECLNAQKHLDANSTERAYWHYGYMMALKDVLGMVDVPSTPLN